MKWARAIVTVALGSATASLAPQQAIAYSRDGLSAEDGETVITKCGPTVYYDFVNTNDHTWTSTEQTWVTQGFERWENVVDRDGGSIVNVVQSATGTPRIDIKVLDNPGGVTGARGYGRCNYCRQPGTPGCIELATYLTTTLDRLRGVATHEMGHVLGLAHVGLWDNVPQDPPPMPTMRLGGCAPSDADLAQIYTLSRDDNAALIERQGVATDPDFHADPSFESSLDWWEFYNTSSYERYDGTDDPRGSWHLRFIGNDPPTGGDPNARQYVHVFNHGRYDGGFWIRKVTSSSFGTINLRIYSRSVQDLVPNQNPNNPPTCRPTGGVLLNQNHTFATPTTSWQFFTSDSFLQSGYLTVEIEGRVTNTLLVACPDPGDCRASGAVDYARARGQ